MEWSHWFDEGNVECTISTLAGGAQRVTKPQSDECRVRMDELMRRDEGRIGAAAAARRQAQERLDDRRERAEMNEGIPGRRNGRIRPAGREQRRLHPSRRGRRTHEKQRQKMQTRDED